MSRSFVRYQGYGFWVVDSDLAMWLHLLVQEVDTLEVVPEWMHALRDEWHFQATSGFPGGISPELDTYVTDELRRAQVIALNDAVLRSLSQRGPTITTSELNAIVKGARGTTYFGDRSVDDFAKIGRHIIKLLRHELTTTPASSVI